jgi:hypothetical protein
LTEEESASLFSSGNKYLFLQAYGPYNIYSASDDLAIEHHFESLCKGQFFSRPIILAKLDERSRIQRVTHVICHGDFGGEFFEMGHAGD